MSSCETAKGSASSDSLTYLRLREYHGSLTQPYLFVPYAFKGRKILEMVKVEREELLGGREKPAPHPNLHLRKRPVQNSICVPLRIYVPSVRTSCGNDSLDILGSSSNLCNH